MTTAALTTFAVSPVDPETEPLPEVGYAEAVEITLSGGMDREAFRQMDVTPPVTLEGCSRDTRPLLGCALFHPFIAAVHLAFGRHRPLMLSPDMIWLTVVQGFALHVRSHAEDLRRRFVSHAGKEELRVRRDGFVRGFAGNDWEGVFTEFSGQIRRHIGDEAHDLLVPLFSTTGVVERAATEVALMDVVAPYFDYTFVTLCGIPSITLEGTPGDWEGLRERAGRLTGLGCDWWLDRLLPVLDQFVRASRGDVDTAFWQGLYKVESESGGPYIDGHILALLPYVYASSDREKPWINRHLTAAPGTYRNGLTTDELPSGLSDVPFRWEYYASVIPMRFVAGFVGVAQDAETLALRPEIGWGVCEAATSGDVPADAQAG